MEDLIKALQIFLKYGNVKYPTHCEHDTLYICGYNIEDLTQEDVEELEKLGFFWSEDENECFMSYKYGSA